MIAQATAALNYNRQVLAEATVVINENSTAVATSNERIEGARKSIGDARAALHDSAKSQRTIEAEILTAQGDDSPCSKAHIEFNESQQALNEERDRVLSSEEYLKKKADLAKEDGSAAKIAKLRHDSLEDDDHYQAASDRFKAATLVYNRIKSELFKANPEWVKASQESRDARVEENKNTAEATRGAMKRMPAARNLREATEIAAEARMNIAQAESVLRNLKVKIPAAPPGMDYSSAGSASTGK